MSKKSIFLILFILIQIQNVCFSTIFRPLPFEKQIEEASGAAEVELENSRVFKSESGMIMTEYTFDISESYNLTDDELENKKLKLSLLGGTHEGITTVIEGAPEFNKNEKSFLLLKKIDSKIYLSNFSLGKFKIQKRDGKIYYVSSVFPEATKYGKISKEEMVELMKAKWKISSMTSKPSIDRMPTSIPSPESESAPVALETRPIIKNIQDLERVPAEEGPVEHGNFSLFFWGTISFILLTLVFIFLRLGKREGEHKEK